MSEYQTKIEKRLNAKRHYEQADDKWLEDKIKREKESIRVNSKMIEESITDIEICEEILAVRKENDKKLHDETN